MGWSQEEANRTIDEIKRRSLLDPEFRTLALVNPLAAIAKVNPKPLPANISVTFIEGSTPNIPRMASGSSFKIVLPAAVTGADELSDAELEQAAGGKTDIQFPIE
jgi:hypothetical protein